MRKFLAALVLLIALSAPNTSFSACTIASICASKENGYGVIGPSELNSSKVVSYGVIAANIVSSSKLVAYGLMTPNIISSSKLVAYGVIKEIPATDRSQGRGPLLFHAFPP